MPARLTHEQVITKFKKVHGTTYNYAKVVYKSNKQLVTITCEVHGDFQQRPRNHQAGEGCPKCGILKHKQSTETRKLTTSTFKERAIQIHGAKYDYTSSIVKGTRSFPDIECKEHGFFKQRADQHLNGNGCPKCGKLLRNFSYSQWELAGRQSKAFKNFTFYVLKCWNEEEEFLKIGKTFTDLTRRYSSKGMMPYKWKPILEYTDTAEVISKLELKVKLSMKKYTPTIRFNGMTECCLTASIQKIKSDVTTAEGNAPIMLMAK